jgi:YggT family protein
MQVLRTLVFLYIVCIWGRVILSWFPVTPGTAMARVNDVLYRITEPVLGPVRRIMPRTGMIDLSPLVVTILIQFVVLGILLPA